MRNLRYADEQQSTVLAEVDRMMPDGATQTDTLSIPANPVNGHYAKILKDGTRIAEFVPDPAAAEAARKAKVAARMLVALADDASAGKGLDQIRAEAKAAASAAIDLGVKDQG